MCWQRRQSSSAGRKTMRVKFEGRLPFGVTAKDLILALIGHVGAAGGTGYAVEYAGSAIRDMPVEGRLTICNLSIELGAKMGLIAPDEKTYEYIRGRAYAPQGEMWERAVAAWRELAERSRRGVRQGSRHRRREDHSAGDLGYQPRARHRRRRSCSRSQGDRRSGAARRDRDRARLYGPQSGSADRRHARRLGLHRIMHQQPVERSARRGRGRAWPQGCARRARLGRAGLGDGQAGCGGRRARQALHRSRLRMARAGMLDVSRGQRRNRRSRPALGLDLEPQFYRPPGTRARALIWRARPWRRRRR